VQNTVPQTKKASEIVTKHFQKISSPLCVDAARNFPHPVLRAIIRTIDQGTFADETVRMARYSAFLGRKVEVHYRAGDICLPASGMFVADSGRSIFLEQRFDQRGTQKTFRWEVPYQYIIRIDELPSESAAALDPFLAKLSAEAAAANPDSSDSKSKASAAGGAVSVLPFAHGAKLA
jgi:hypothetical protein